MHYSESDYPKPSLLKWAMLVVLLDNDVPMIAREIDRDVAKLMKISDSMYEAILKNGKQYLPYRLGWERTKSKKMGYIEKVPDLPRYWQLTESGRAIATRKVKMFK
ncbi:Restriction system protein Mrr-like N-terminal domain containing protein [Candidatus Nanopelagicaceae bacterium]